MIKDKLYIFLDDNSSFTDYSYEGYDYARDSFSHTIVSAEDFIYIGFEKPINAVFAEMVTANTNAATMTVKYYNGTSFTAVSGQLDETKGFTRSGFINWDRNLTSEAVTTVNSQEAYWYQISLSANSSASEWRAINLVFSDDQDLKNEYFEINDFLPSGASSHILSHVSARNTIISKLKQDGRYKADISTGEVEDMTQWDLLQYTQIRQASAFLALSKIFANIADDQEDIYWKKGERFYGLYHEAMNQMYLSLDKDDDGILDDHERYLNNASVLVRR